MIDINTQSERKEQDNYVIISFNTRENEDNGFYELLLKRVPVRSAGKHKYVVNPRGLQILNSKNIKYKLDETTYGNINILV
jgi:hypothetical protein